MRRKGKKLLSMILTVALVASGFGMTVPADAANRSGTGICKHHPVHTAECGYRPAVAASPCTHEHTDACYTVIPEATPGDASPSNVGEKRVLTCSHAYGGHDSECGYREADPGSPCAFICEECNAISYMDANGKVHHEVVGNLQNVSRTVSQWGENGEEIWYYLDKSVTYSADTRVQVSGDVVLVLGRGATLTASRGIDVPEGATLTIYGQSENGGRLVAVSESMGAAIGGPSNGTKGAGRIVINSGTVEATAKGNFEAAGIGGGYVSKNGAQVEINGGVVKATGAFGGPGIGNVVDYAENSVTITGGTVTAVGGTCVTDGIRDSAIAQFRTGGAGIGGGSGSGSGEITITGGTVTATGGAGAPGIGSGSQSGSVGAVTISGKDTVVTATGSDEGAAGIGGGRYACSAGAVEIADGAKVTATGGRTAIDGEIDLGSLYDGDYIVLGGTQGAADKAAAVLRVGGKTWDVTGDAEYKYLEIAPVTVGSVGVSPKTVSANIGDRISFTVEMTGGSHKGADLTEALGTSWSVEGAAKSPNTIIDEDGILQIGGDEDLEHLTVSAKFDVPDGVEVTGRASDVNVHQIKYTVSFDANGGVVSGAAALRTTKGRLTESLPAAARTGYTFEGWYTQAAGGSRVSESYVFSGDTTLYAHWKINSYTVTYNSMGGSQGIFTRSVDHGGKAPTPATPVKERSVFEGWYTDLSYTSKWNFDADRVTGNITLYAKWSDAVLEVNVTAAASPAEGGKALYGGVYRMGAVVTLKAEAADGYRFLYWTEGGAIVSHSAEYRIEAEEDRSLTAVFEKIVVVPEEKEETSGGASDSGSAAESSPVPGGTEENGSSNGSGSDETENGSGSGSDESEESGSDTGSAAESSPVPGSAEENGSGSGSGSDETENGSDSGSGSDETESSSGSSHSSGSASSGSSHSSGSSSSGSSHSSGSGSSGGGRSSGGGSGSSRGSGSSSAAGNSAEKAAVQNTETEAAPDPTVVPVGEITTMVTTVAADAADTEASEAVTEAAKAANIEIVTGAWVQKEESSWALQYSDGTVASDSWVYVTESDGAHWYHFGQTGLMDIGWLNLGGRWYYLQEAHNGGAGRMLTGWQMVNGKWYYFSSANDGTMGVMLANTMTPDGFWVNEFGEWVQ